MSLPIKTLPIHENWTCTGCGLCCRGNVVPLDDRDLEKLREQRWDEHPDYQGIKIVVRESVSGKSHRLAQRDDGSCVFLQSDGLCAIHKAFGLEAKPLVCQTYPLQLIPLDGKAVLTLRRSCPSAASDQGQPLDAYLQTARDLGTRRGILEHAGNPPAVSARFRGSWREVKQVTGTIGQLLQDDRYPLVRRLVHTLLFCDLLEDCRLKQVDASQIGELLEILRESAMGNAGEYFSDRQPPGRAGGVLFRQIVADYLRLHSNYRVRETFGERWRLFRMAIRMARGRGLTPRVHADFPVASFESLESPLGHLAEEVQRPLNRYYEVNGASGQYTFASKPHWTVLDSCRALMLSYPIALWMLRLWAQDGTPTQDQAVEMVTMIDRGQGYRPLLGRQHRRRVGMLRRLGQLPRLLAWYAR